MALTDWLLVGGAILVAAIVIKGFWKFDRTKSLDQPDRWQDLDGPG
jgi:hypothetical protein